MLRMLGENAIRLSYHHRFYPLKLVVLGFYGRVGNTMVVLILMSIQLYKANFTQCLIF